MSEDRMAVLEQELSRIQECNLRLEADKAWEISLFRLVVISSLAYLITGFMFAAIGDPKCWIDALIPVGGYLLSVRSLPIIKQWWLERRYRK